MSSLLARTASAGRPARLVWVVREDQPASSERRWQTDQAIVEREVLGAGEVLVAPCRLVLVQ